MKIIAWDINLVNFRTSIASAIILGSILVTSCGKDVYRVYYTSISNEYIAKMSYYEEGTLGSTRYRVTIGRLGEPGGMTVFDGENGDVSAPEWISPSELIIPFCFGSIDSVESVLPYRSSNLEQFNGRSSSMIRVHVVTAPDTIVSGKRYCEKKVSLSVKSHN